jgi:hypothetical protein
MPRTVQVTPALTDLLIRQDGVATVEQLSRVGFSINAIDKRVARNAWRRLLPGIFLTSNGTATRRQLLVAAWLWSHAEGAIDGADACAWHELRPPLRLDDPVHVVAPWGSTTRSRNFVIVRRTIAEIRIGGRGIVPYVDAPTASPPPIAR